VIRVSDLLLAAAVVLVVLAAVCSDCSSPVEAQDRARRAALVAAAIARQQTYILGRICISEGGWAEADVCAAYHWTLIAGSPNPARWDRHACNYTHLCDAHRPPSRVWLLGLGESDARPIGFPSQLPWRTARDRHGAQIGRTGYLDRWHLAVEIAAELVRNPRNPCAGTPTDWASGARVAVFRAEYPRAVEIDCPGTDVFLRRSPE